MIPLNNFSIIREKLIKRIHFNVSGRCLKKQKTKHKLSKTGLEWLCDAYFKILSSSDSGYGHRDFAHSIKKDYKKKKLTKINMVTKLTPTLSIKITPGILKRTFSFKF